MITVHTNCCLFACLFSTNFSELLTKLCLHNVCNLIGQIKWGQFWSIFCFYGNFPPFFRTTSLGITNRSKEDRIASSWQKSIPDQHFCFALVFIFVWHDKSFPFSYLILPLLCPSVPPSSYNCYYRVDYQARSSPSIIRLGKVKKAWKWTVKRSVHYVVRGAVNLRTEVTHD